MALVDPEVLAALSAGILELHWATDDNGVVHLALYGLDPNQQLKVWATHETGPFETRLDLAQWAWRALASALPPTVT